MLPPTSVTLELPTGRARLEPLTLAHAEDLFAAAQSDAVWLYMPIPRPRTLADVGAMIGKAQVAQAAGSEVPFAVIDRHTGRAIGSTRYLEIQPANHALEIGWTWYAAACQRTSINTECKFLLLRHAFESLGAVRVQLRTDGRNERSQAAIARIGAVREGRFRKHRVMHDGYTRDTVFFSILAEEWPAARASLLGRLAHPHATTGPSHP